VLDRLDDPQFMLKFHAVGWWLWLGTVPLVAFTGLKDSIPFIAAASIYANAIGHLSAWQAVRAEKESS
jgi:hypothetical protein